MWHMGLGSLGMVVWGGGGGGQHTSISSATQWMFFFHCVCDSVYWCLSVHSLQYISWD